MQMQAPSTFEGLQPEEVRSLGPEGIEARTNHLGRLIFSLFKSRRSAMMELPDLQDAHEDAKAACAQGDCSTVAEADRAVAKCRSEIQIAKVNIEAITQELGFINHFHSYAWNFTQVLLDTIEIGHSNPRSGRWK